MIADWIHIVGAAAWLCSVAVVVIVPRPMAVDLLTQPDMSRTYLLCAVLAPAFIATSSTPATSEKVQLIAGNLHAAALTKPRAAGDSLDAPFFVVSIIAPRANSAAMVPDSGGLSIRLDEAMRPRLLTELTLAGGDSVQVLISVIENPKVSADARAATLAARPTGIGSAEATRLVAPLVKQGANVIGTVTLLLINEGGSVFWRRLDCLDACAVLTGPAGTAISAGQPLIGVAELTGSGGTYHLQLAARRAP